MPTDESRSGTAPAREAASPDHPPLHVTLLGTGTSTGVPVIGCSCPTCTSSDPRDRRLRCACFIEVQGTASSGDGHESAAPLSILIDTGPDFRQQALRAGITRVDAVCYTHHHFDHLAGLDDLRPFLFRNRTPIPLYAHEITAQVMRRNYDYIFGDDPYPGAATVDLRVVEEPFYVTSRYDTGARIRVQPLQVYHGDLPIYGYRVGRFAYLTDTSRIPPSNYDHLHDLDVLVIDALRPEPHPTHFSFSEAVAVARRIGARQTYFIHMSHNVRHADVDDSFPDGINLAHDELEFDVQGGISPSSSQG